MATITEADSATRASVIDAAERLFELYGYRKTTVEEIAQEAGIGKGSIYLHFKSKEEIGICWLRKLHDGVFTSMNVIARNGDLSVPDRLASILVQRVMSRFDIFARHRKSMDEAMDSLKECLRERREAFHNLEAELLSELIRQGIELNELRTHDPLRDAVSMVIATNSLLPYGLKPSHLGDRETVFQRATDVADLLIRGIRARRVQ